MGDQNELIATLRALASSQQTLAVAVRTHLTGKDFWDKFGAVSVFLSSVVIAFVGTIFTREYDIQQTKINELTILEKFIPHLASGNRSEQQVAIIEISALGDTEVAARVAKLYPSEGTIAGLRDIAKHGDSDQRATANDALRALGQSFAKVNLSSTWTARTISYIGNDEALTLRMTTLSPGDSVIGYGMRKDNITASQLSSVGIDNPKAVLDGEEPITVDEADALLENSLLGCISYARSKVGGDTFDRLSDARKYALVDFMYFAGNAAFAQYLAPLVARGDFAAAGSVIRRMYFGGRRGSRNAAMMQTGQWVDIPSRDMIPLYHGSQV